MKPIAKENNKNNKNDKNDKNINKVYKYVVLGEPSVGKSSIIYKFVKDVVPEKITSTIGIEFAFQNVKVDNNHVRVQIWDTAGQEEFNSLIAMYYKNVTC